MVQRLIHSYAFLNVSEMDKVFIILPHFVPDVWVEAIFLNYESCVIETVDHHTSIWDDGSFHIFKVFRSFFVERDLIDCEYLPGEYCFLDHNTASLFLSIRGNSMYSWINFDFLWLEKLFFQPFFLHQRLSQPIDCHYMNVQKWVERSQLVLSIGFFSWSCKSLILGAGYSSWLELVDHLL